MNARPARTLAHDAAALLGDAATVTLFDPTAPSTCVSVRLRRRGGAVEGVMAAAGALVDRLRLGLQPAFFCAVDGDELEGTLLVRVRELDAVTLALEAQVVSATLAPTPVTLGSIPRT